MLLHIANEDKRCLFRVKVGEHNNNNNKKTVSAIFTSLY